MPKQIKIGLNTLSVSITLIAVIFGGLWSVSKISYAAGADNNNLEAKVTANTVSNIATDKALAKEILRATTIDNDRAECIEAINTKISDLKTVVEVQNAILIRIERTLPYASRTINK